MLPCDLSLITLHISDCPQFTDIYISQGRVPTCVSCGRIFVANLSTNLAIKEFWNRLWFGEVMGKNLVSCFFDSQCTFSLCRSTDTFDCLYAEVRTELTSLIIIQEILFSCESIIITDCLRYAILVWVTFVCLLQFTKSLFLFYRDITVYLCNIYWLHMIIHAFYAVSQKTRHQTLGHNFTN